MQQTILFAASQRPENIYGLTRIHPSAATTVSRLLFHVAHYRVSVLCDVLLGQLAVLHLSCVPFLLPAYATAEVLSTLGTDKYFSFDANILSFPLSRVFVSH